MAFKIYKRGQGYYTRLITALASFTIVAIGSFVLFRKLGVVGNPWIEIFVPVGVCAGFTLLIFWIVNKPKLADFMIAAEGEIKKVSWASRAEIISSTMVVIGVVILMSSLLFLADLFFKFVMIEVLKIY
jgi:preprotein translocase subunit SecE